MITNTLRLSGSQNVGIGIWQVRNNSYDLTKLMASNNRVPKSGVEGSVQLWTNASMS